MRWLIVDSFSQPQPTAISFEDPEVVTSLFYSPGQATAEMRDL